MAKQTPDQWLNEQSRLRTVDFINNQPVMFISDAEAMAKEFVSIYEPDRWIRDRPPTLHDAKGNNFGTYVWAYEPSVKKYPVRSLLWTYVAAHGLIWQPIRENQPQVPNEFQ